jgi:hypothetical protein
MADQACPRSCRSKATGRARKARVGDPTVELNPEPEVQVDARDPFDALPLILTLTLSDLEQAETLSQQSRSNGLNRPADTK